MDSTVENAEAIAPKRTSPRSRQHCPAIREQCEALYKSGWLPAAISKQTDVPKGTITQWAKRYHWTETRDKVGQILQKGVAATIAEKLAQCSELIQDALSSELVEQANVLRDSPPRSVGDLIKGRSATVKTIVDSGDKLFGWSKQEGKGCLIQIGYLKELQPDPVKPAIELTVAENL
jgi:hypothetical protein